MRTWETERERAKRLESGLVYTRLENSAFDGQRYAVERDGLRLGTVEYCHGDDGYRGRVYRGRRHYKGHGWKYDCAIDQIGARDFRLRFDTRREAAVALLDTYEARAMRVGGTG